MRRGINKKVLTAQLTNFQILTVSKKSTKVMKYQFKIWQIHKIVHKSQKIFGDLIYKNYYLIAKKLWELNKNQYQLAKE